MTAICGIVNFDGGPAEIDRLRRMAAAVGCAEPEDGELWTDLGVCFAQLASAEDAVQCERPHVAVAGAGRFAAVADTRLDNLAALTSVLGRNRCRQGGTSGGAAVLLVAFERWAEAVPEHLKGAFAAAVWDKEARSLLLIRDHLGERALYWYCNPPLFLFASDPAMLLASGHVPRACYVPRLLAYLLRRRPDPTWSYFDGIHRLPEAHLLKVSPAGQVLQQYWSFESISTQPMSRADAAEGLAERLHSAVACRVARHGGTGVLLSGGLDSSSVAAMASAFLATRGQALHALTWASRSGDSIDERSLSRLLTHSRTNVVEHAVEADDLWPLSRYPEAYSDPSDPETNTYPDLLLTTLETARNAGVRVMMNGVGGDQVVGWLTLYLTLLLGGRFPALWQRVRQTGLRSLLQQLRMAMPGGLPDWLTPLGRRLARDAGLDQPPVPWKAMASNAGLRLFALSDPTNAGNLERFDRLARRTGVRICAPWHDIELASLSLGLPDKAVDTTPPRKSLLREAMAGYLPEGIRNAPTEQRQRPHLRACGLFAKGREVVEELLSRSQLEAMGLAHGAQLLETYRQRSPQAHEISRFWEFLTGENWLRAQNFT